MFKFKEIQIGKRAMFSFMKVFGCATYLECWCCTSIYEMLDRKLLTSMWMGEKYDFGSVVCIDFLFEVSLKPSMLVCSMHKVVCWAHRNDEGLTLSDASAFYDLTVSIKLMTIVQFSGKRFFFLFKKNIYIYFIYIYLCQRINDLTSENWLSATAQKVLNLEGRWFRKNI